MRTFATSSRVEQRGRGGRGMDGHQAQAGARSCPEKMCPIDATIRKCRLQSLVVVPLLLILTLLPALVESTR